MTLYEAIVAGRRANGCSGRLLRDRQPCRTVPKM